MQNKTINQKAQLTNLQKYGVRNPQQNPKIKAKAIKTLSQHGSVPTSKQQVIIYEMIKTKYPDAELNYPHSTCSLDVYLVANGVQIDIEYDAKFFHDKQRDIKRDKFLQSQGFKILRVRSGHLLPTEQELFDAIDYLANTEHHFKEIVLSDWKEKEEEECQEQLQATQ